MAGPVGTGGSYDEAVNPPASPPPDPPRSDPPAVALRLAKLRERRVFAPRDESLAFLAGAFKQDIAKPFRQLEGVLEAWVTLVPDDLRERSRLESLQRGVLTVVVDSSATHFRFDEHVRRGLAVQLAQQSNGVVLRRIRLRTDTAAFLDEADTSPAAPADDTLWTGRDAPPEEFDPELPR